jgi:hypothetical protein
VYDVGVAPEVIADQARRSDEAVRRLREESRRRIEQRGRAAPISRCMLGAMLGMLVFVTLQSRRIHQAEIAMAAQARAAAAAPAISEQPAARNCHCYKRCGISPRRSSSRTVCRCEESK